MSLLKTDHPTFHLVLGSGFKDSLQTGVPPEFKILREVPFSAVPGLHSSTVPGHDGKYVVVEHAPTKKTGYIQVGRLHGYEGLSPKDVIRTVMVTRELGVEHYFLTNAAGGLDPQHKVGDAMVITDHINLTGNNPLVGKNPTREDGKEWGPRFPDLTNVYDREWRKLLLKNLKAQKNIGIHEGVYVGLLGPSFETPAEIKMFAKLGIHSVGMSTVWEAIALKHSGARVVGVSLVSNIAAGIIVGADGVGEEINHFEILDACKASSSKILNGMLLSVHEFLLR